jgi:hypothetical protein
MQILIKKTKPSGKKTIIAVAAVVVFLVLIIAGYYVVRQFYPGYGVAGDLRQEGITSGDLNNVPEEQKSGVALIPLGASGEKLSYEEALSIYKYSGYLMQFTDCKAKPGSLTMKGGNNFMIDNRDAQARKIVIQSYGDISIGAYGFTIISAPAKEGAYTLMCDGVLSANINVTK